MRAIACGTRARWGEDGRVRVPDLQRQPPRRWSEEIAGIKWLPRLIDKARASLAGTLGPYLFGQSPIDGALLHALGLSYGDFAKIVGRSSTDDDVFRELFMRTADGVERARAWSRRLPARLGWLLFFIDLDDGHVRAWYLKPLRAPTSLAANAFTGAIKRLWPAKFDAE